MGQGELIPHLFRTEYRKIVSVLGTRFGFREAARLARTEADRQALLKKVSLKKIGKPGL